MHTFHVTRAFVLLSAPHVPRRRRARSPALHDFTFRCREEHDIQIVYRVKFTLAIKLCNIVFFWNTHIDDKMTILIQSEELHKRHFFRLIWSEPGGQKITEKTKQASPLHVNVTEIQVGSRQKMT